MRLIDADELKKEIYTMTEWNGDVHRVIYASSIDDAQTVEERPKGKWEKISDGRVMCTKCTFTHEKWLANAKFCPNCGAETEVEENVQGRPLCEECKKLFDESEVQSK